MYEVNESTLAGSTRTKRIIFSVVHSLTHSLTHLRLLRRPEREQNGEVLWELPGEGLAVRQQEVRTGPDEPRVLPAAPHALKGRGRRLEVPLLRHGQRVHRTCNEERRCTAAKILDPRIERARAGITIGLMGGSMDGGAGGGAAADLPICWGHPAHRVAWHAARPQRRHC